jgi:hypothetical protein
MSSYLDQLSEATAPAAADLALIEAADLSTEYKITLGNLMKVINSLTALASADDDSDVFLIYDSTASSAKKITLANFLTILGGLASMSDVASGDTVPVYDVSAGTQKRATMLQAAAGMGRIVQVPAIELGGPCSTGDGKFFIVIPSYLDGLDLIAVHAKCITAGTTGTMTVQVRNVTQAADMLSTRITIDSTELGSDTAAAPAVIDTANDDVAAYDTIAIDVDTVHTTVAIGLLVTLVFG